MSSRLPSLSFVLLAATPLVACPDASRPPESSATAPAKSVPSATREVPSDIVEAPVVMARAEETEATASTSSAPANAPPATLWGTLPDTHVLRKGPPPPVEPHYDPASLSGRLGRVMTCYETALRADPRLSGSVNVTFVIGVDGSVVHASERGSTLKDPQMPAPSSRPTASSSCAAMTTCRGST